MLMLVRFLFVPRHTTQAAANKFDKLVFYLEACESGSMFENLLPTNINVFATTASSATESSWGTYCPPDDMVNGKELNSCLGDLYSVNWMEDCDGQGLERTLEGQFEVVQKLTNLSHVTKYGTQTYASTDTVKEFLAPAKATATKASSSSSASKSSSNVDTHDVELVQDFYKYMRADKQGKTLEQKAALAEQLIAVVQARQAADEKYASLGEIVSATPADFEAHEVVDADCVKAAYTTFQAKCGKIDSYSLKYSHQVADLCTTFNADSIDAILTTLCQ
jgi:legumain